MTTARLAAVAIPGAVVGVLSALGPIIVSAAAGAAQDWLWDTLPATFGTEGDSPWWILGMLTLTGLVAGSIVAWVPVHAGDGPATTSLVAAPLPPRTVPGLALALALGLAGGVSLGPENPIIAVNVALAVGVVARLRRGAPQQVVILMAASGTLDAMVGTPVGVALLMTEMLAGRGKVELFDRLFGPPVFVGVAVALAAHAASRASRSRSPSPPPSSRHDRRRVRRLAGPVHGRRDGGRRRGAAGAVRGRAAPVAAGAQPPAGAHHAGAGGRRRLSRVAGRRQQCRATGLPVPVLR